MIFIVPRRAFPLWYVAWYTSPPVLAANICTYKLPLRTLAVSPPLLLLDVVYVPEVSLQVVLSSEAPLICVLASLNGALEAFRSTVCFRFSDFLEVSSGSLMTLEISHGL